MVRESWDGLGYYRRAANLHRLAQEVVRDQAGVIPADPAELRRLPGVAATPPGRWRALPSSARPPAVDTNVARVLRRAFHPRTSGKALDQQSLEHRRAHAARAGKDRVGIQSGDHGAGSADLYGAGGALWGVPGAVELRYGTAGG